MQICDLLQLNAEVVGAQADAYEGYATALERNAKSVGDFARVCHYTSIAASYRSASDPERAAKGFLLGAERARKVYRMISENSSADPARVFGWIIRISILGACAASNPSESRFFAETLGEINFPTHVAHLFLLSALRGVVAHPDDRRAEEEVDIFARRFFELPEVPVGVLQLPVGFLLRLASLSKESPSEDPQKWAVDFGSRLQERVSLAQANRGQWQQLHCRLLPIEPEALLAVATWLQLSRRRNLSNREFLGLIRGLPSAMQAYVEAARIIFGVELS